MPISAGTRLGPYEILSPLGAGGMGEVYRAKDTRLDRTVAVKVLPTHLSTNPDLRQRFEHEARAVSSLNHPNICTLHDVGNQDGIDYLVMEYLEGETLAERLQKGPLPSEQVLRHGLEIADALDKAHKSSIVHRDLKPGNIMLTKSGAKLMDFGLAKLQPPASQTVLSGVSALATEAKKNLTAEGSIVGTFQYMAPEQLEGKEADSRVDIWALGCVLYEMATGKRAFEGKSQASLITAIMGSQPAPLSQLAPLSPPGLERLVQACLAKDPADRLQSAHDIRMQLAWLAEGGSQAGVPAPVAARRRSRERLAWTVAAVGLIAAGVLAWRVVASRAPAPEAIRSLVGLPPDAGISTNQSDVALAPDGRTVAFVADDALWVRPLGSDAATRLPGTESAYKPFWSPDSRTIAYFDRKSGKLMTVPAAAGSPTSVCSTTSGRGGSWSRDGTLLFAPALSGPLMRVSVTGGDPVAVTTLDSARHESGHRFPSFLPDGEHFLYAVIPGGPDGWDTYVGSLRSQTVKRLLTARSVAVYAEPGFLLFERDGRVLAQHFDPGRLELRGAPVPIADAPELADNEAAPVASASRNGRLAILRSEPADTRLEMHNQTGTTVARYDLPPAPWRVSSVSPDERRAVILKGHEIWMLDLDRSVPMRFGTNSTSELGTTWSPDGSQLAFVSDHDGREEIHVAGLDGRADPVPTTDEQFKEVWDWSHDGRTIVFGVFNAETGFDLWLLPMDGDRKPVPYLRGAATEMHARISPDGRWLAYDSNETGEWEVYVQSFPEPGRKVRVSVDGGTLPAWFDGGKQLGYLNAARQEILAVPVKEGVEFEPGPPRKIADAPPDSTSGVRFGDRMQLLVSVATNRSPRDIRLILDWTALVER